MVYRNKGGFTTVMLIFFVFFVLFVVIIAGTSFYAFETFHNVGANLTGINIGNVSFEQTYQDTLGRGLQAVISTLSTASFALILGMIIIMILIGAKFPNQNKTWIILDIFIVIVAFITAVYISIIFNSFINSSEVFLDIYSIDLQRSSTFLLNLPLIVAIVGGIIMILTYVPFKRKDPRVLEFN